MVSSRPAGVAWLLDGLWRQLGVDTALGKVLGGRKFTTAVERVIFAMVANRAIDPIEAGHRRMGLPRCRPAWARGDGR